MTRKELRDRLEELCRDTRDDFPEVCGTLHALTGCFLAGGPFPAMLLDATAPVTDAFLRFSATHERVM